MMPFPSSTASARGNIVQVHLLTSYPASLLNRDDTGAAKRIPFGGVMRTRISSQCLKKHWRESTSVASLGGLAVRSTRIYEDLVAKPLVNTHGADPTEAMAIAQYLLEQTLTKAKKSGKPASGSKSGKKQTKQGAKEVDTQEASDDMDVPAPSESESAAPGTTRSKQILVLTAAETRYLSELGVETLARLRTAGVVAATHEDVAQYAPIDSKALKKTLQALPASLDTALFGRFVTSDVFARVDSAVGVAHAFTTHPEASEIDYFTAVDLLNTEGTGAGLVGETELTTGVFYTYVVFDMAQLRANLGAHADLAEQLARHMVLAMATVSPKAKRGSTAACAYAECVLLERGTAQPRTLANAFLDPVRTNGAGLMQESIRRLLSHRDALERMYGPMADTMAYACAHDIAGAPPAQSLAAALDTIFPVAR